MKTEKELIDNIIKSIEEMREFHKARAEWCDKNIAELKGENKTGYTTRCKATITAQVNENNSSYSGVLHFKHDCKLLGHTIISNGVCINCGDSVAQCDHCGSHEHTKDGHEAHINKLLGRK